ncbi:MAG TPA: FAD-dependent oxidoreductase [Candidatus Saccharimonadia bacterium]|nr:FAD-dependent oxidoreductase [Candidatus Saccharimonadia bacterium]
MADNTNTKEVHDLIAIGAGPASLAAAVYTTREDIGTVLYEKGAIGGLAAITDIIDNYPGFPRGVGGIELADNLKDHAERFGTDIRLGEVLSLSKDGNLIKLVTTDGDLYAKTVLIATGSDYKKLNIPGEVEYLSKGVHYCATCDGAFYRDKKIVVIGGGNSAVQESLFLTKFATSIDLLVRSDKLRASEILIDELKRNKKITIHFNTTPKEIIGENGKVTKVLTYKTGTDIKKDFITDGVFIFIGLYPNTDFLKSSIVKLNSIGQVITSDDLETNVEGIYAAGDVREDSTMQIASAVGEGAKAALKIREYLDANFK